MVVGLMVFTGWLLEELFVLIGVKHKRDALRLLFGRATLILCSLTVT